MKFLDGPTLNKHMSNGGAKIEWNERMCWMKENGKSLPTMVEEIKVFSKSLMKKDHMRLTLKAGY